jgi:hypothetical protein
MFLDASTTLYSTDLFRYIASGVIRIACSSMAADYFVPWKKLDKDGVTIVLHADNEKKKLPIQVKGLNDEQRESGIQFYLLTTLGGKNGVMTESAQEDSEQKEWRLNEWMIQGIVLRPTDLIKGEFYRIGSIKFYKNMIFWLSSGHLR